MTVRRQLKVSMMLKREKQKKWNFHGSFSTNLAKIHAKNMF